MERLTPHEFQLADAILAVIDHAGRVIAATPGSHYQWDKTRGLIEATDRLRRLATPPEHAVRGELVTAWVARDAHHYTIGRALFSLPANDRPQSTIVRPEAASPPSNLDRSGDANDRPQSTVAKSDIDTVSIEVDACDRDGAV